MYKTGKGRGSGTPTSEVRPVPSKDIVFPSVDVQGGRFILCFINPSKTGIQSSVLRRSHSWPRIEPCKIPEGVPRRILSWPRINTRRFPGRLNSEFDLPRSVTVLENGQGSKVFLVGTNHVSKESEADVAQTIQEVQPDSVIIERCVLRIGDLLFDGEAIKKYLDHYKSISFTRLWTKYGLMKGVLNSLEQDNSVRLGQTLGVLPGGESRRAFQEAKKIPGCVVRLGDRPINITNKRAYASLSLKQKLLYLLVLRRTKRFIKRLKSLDLLEKGVFSETNMIGVQHPFPKLTDVIVNERDLILTYALQQSAETVSPSPRYVVGVVGLGHVPGIKKNWNKVTIEDVAPLFRLPGPSVLSIVFCAMILLLLLVGGSYGIAKLMLYINDSARSALH